MSVDISTRQCSPAWPSLLFRPFRTAHVEVEPYREATPTPQDKSKGGRHSAKERGSGRLSQGGLVVHKGGHEECPSASQSMGDLLAGIQRGREWMWCPADEFVMNTDGSATAVWEVAVLHRSAAGHLTWCGSLSAPIYLGSTGTDVLGAARLTNNAAELTALLAALTWRATLQGQHGFDWFDRAALPGLDECGTGAAAPTGAQSAPRLRIHRDDTHVRAPRPLRQ